MFLFTFLGLRHGDSGDSASKSQATKSSIKMLFIDTWLEKMNEQQNKIIMARKYLAESSKQCCQSFDNFSIM